MFFSLKFKWVPGRVKYLFKILAPVLVFASTVVLLSAGGEVQIEGLNDGMTELLNN